MFCRGKSWVTHGGTRTPNLPLRRRTPYPLGHAGWVKNESWINIHLLFMVLSAVLLTGVQTECELARRRIRVKKGKESQCCLCLLVLESHWGIAAAVAAFSLSSLSLCLSGFGNGTHSEGMSISKLVDRPQCIGRTGVLELGRKHYLKKKWLSIKLSRLILVGSITSW